MPLRWRSVLYAPAIRPDLARKLPRSQPDLGVLDLEGTVAPSAKVEARAHLPTLLEALSPQLPVLVRVNRADQPWFEDDVHAAVSAGASGILVPRVERLEELDLASAVLAAAGAPTLPLGVGLESALGIADARPLLAHPRCAIAYFGAEDFVADMGGVRTRANLEVAHARAHVVLCARAGGVTAFDQIVTDLHDDARFEQEAGEARALGYHGKACIHPRQVPLANRAFTPTAQEVARARRILTAFEAASAKGVASVAVDGELVDEPVAERARRLLAKVE